MDDLSPVSTSSLSTSSSSSQDQVYVIMLTFIVLFIGMVLSMRSSNNRATTPQSRHRTPSTTKRVQHHAQYPSRKDGDDVDRSPPSSGI